MQDFETHPRGTAEVLAQLRAEREALTLQVEEQRKNSERYLWLRNESVKHKDYAPTATLQDGKGIKVFYEMYGDRFKPTYFLSGADLDSVIDAAIKETP